ncbi:MAG: VWA domain-containing protein [Synergistaceae bacterium]|nr:VWA domain-containing protein [Synergistaceae bacterium]
MGMRRAVLPLAAVLLFCLALPSWGEPVRLEIEQVRREGTELVVVVDVRDGSDNALNDLAPEQVRATWGSRALPLLSLARYDRIGERGTYLFLVDVSKSLKPDQFEALRKGLADWVQGLGEGDRFGLMAFGESVRVLADLGSDKEAFLEALPMLKATDNWTHLNLGLLRGLELGRRLDAGLPPRRLLVVISDGIEDSLGGASREEVLRRFQEASIPVYALGYTPPPLTDKKKEGLAHLGEMARASGGEIVVVEGAKDFDGGYRNLRSFIERAWVARFDLTGLSPSEEGRFQLLLQSGNKVLSDGLDLSFPEPSTADDVSLLPARREEPTKTAPAGTAGEGPGKTSRLALPLIGLGLLLLLAVFVLARKKKEEALPPSSPSSSPLVSGGGLRFALTVVRGAQPSRRFELDLTEPLVVGRSSTKAGLVLEGDLGISGAHMRLFEKEGALWVEDMRSTNGTFLNGVALDGTYRLKDGDLILLGGTELRVSLPERR